MREGVSSPDVFDWKPRLAELEEKNLLRALRTIHGRPAARVTVEGRVLLNLASNDYLDLSGHPQVVAGAKAALDEAGAGATASRLLGGTLSLHERLEAALADLKRTASCAVFPSGHHANTGTLPALLDPEDTVILDRLSHASLIDGARLSRAKLLVFRHNDVEDLERVLHRAPVTGRRWIVTESIFSMDGDVAPLCEMAFLTERYNARLYVDEAHATGVFGVEGRGVVNALGLEKKVEVSMGTLSKALGSQGGYVAGSEDLVRWIHNKARSFIYSTALAPASCGAALASLALARASDDRRRHLLALSARLRDGLSLITGVTKAPSRIKSPYTPFERGPIVPFVVGEESRALVLARKLWDAGFYAPAVRFPTVPAGEARLRFSLTAGHTEEDVERLLDVLGK
jgi:8-amino-7-oxononanoate synthase